VSVKNALSIAVLADTILLFLYTSQLSIGYDEARFVFDRTGIAGNLAALFCEVFGMSDLAARAPFVLLHAASLFLLYDVSSTILKKESDRLISVMLFMLLPSANISALLVNKSGIIIALTLLFLSVLKRGYLRTSFVLLGCFSLLDNAFAVLFLALIFYGMSKDDKRLIVLNLVLFAINMYLFGFDNGGKPKSAFLDTFGVYLAIFSPLIFFYFVYSLYKSFIYGPREALFYISFWALIFSLIVSIRQKIHFEDFAPFAVIAVIFMVKVFFSSYRVRLRVHRRGYKTLGYTLLLSLVLSCTALFASKLFYPFISDPKKNFAYDYHVARELADKLKRVGVDSIVCDDKELSLRLKFYGIGDNGERYLSARAAESGQKVSISYINTNIATFYVTKLNTF